MNKHIFLLVVFLTIFLTSCNDISVINTNDMAHTSKPSKTTIIKEKTTQFTTTNKTAKTTTAKKQTVKRQQDKTTGIKKEVIPIDRFTSIDQMISKAKTYKTLDDVYESSGFDQNGHYYLNFSEKKLTMIFEDRIIIAPKSSADYELLKGGLYPQGYYYFSFRYSKGSFELFVDTFKDSSKLKKGQKPIYNINGTDVYEDVGYLWFYNGYCINVRPPYKLSEKELAEMIDNLNLIEVTL